MSSARAAFYADFYQDSLKLTVIAAKGVPEDRRLRQAQAGKAHPLWLVGHLAFTLDVIVNQCATGGGPILPGDFAGRFAPHFVDGAPISGDAAAYPDWAQVLDAYKTAGRGVVERIRALTDEDLAGPPKGSAPEPIQGFFASMPVENIVRYLLMHDAYHRGQLNLLAALD